MTRRLRPGRFDSAMTREPVANRLDGAGVSFSTREKSTPSREKYNVQIPNLVLVLTTMPDDARADELARTLVEERLAACVNVLAPMMSTYRWKGRVEHDPERQLVVKTTRDRLAALETRLRALHPYELPEFIVVESDDASERYLSWVRDETRSG